MAKKKLPSLYKRDFLNKDKGSAYIIIDASVEPHWNYEDGTTLDAGVELKDCNRQISLEFYANNMKEYAKVMKKMDLLIGRLEELREFMRANKPSEGKVKRTDKRRYSTLDDLKDEINESEGN